MSRVGVLVHKIDTAAEGAAQQQRAVCSQPAWISWYLMIIICPVDRWPLKVWETPRIHNTIVRWVQSGNNASRSSLL